MIILPHRRKNFSGFNGASILRTRWTLEESSGDFLDTNTSGQTPNPAIIQANPITRGVDGLLGKCIKIAPNGWISSKNDDLSLWLNNPSFTIMMWCKPISYPSSGNFMACFHHGLSGYTAGGYYYQIETLIDSAGVVLSHYYGDAFVPTPYVYAPLNEWTHITQVVLQYPVSKNLVYVNGVLAGTRNGINLAAGGGSPNILRIGRPSYFVHTYYDGFIDDVRIYSRELTAQEIFSIYARTDLQSR